MQLSARWRSGATALLGAVLFTTGVGAQASAPNRITVATYNIRHGRGMDDRVNLERTATTIRALDAGIVALQEVDRGVARSGSIDQPDSLGTLLGLAHAFGAFFPYQGGEYGLAILSRYPVHRTTTLRLPDGNEPRVALLVEVELPSGTRVTAVNVHFDWVADDTFRYAQVEALAAVLDTLAGPVILLGDFNDVPGSRTLQRWANRFAVAEKPFDDRFTFSSVAPEKEIDHILLGPHERWQHAASRVVREPLTSDHRPVVAVVQLR